MERVDDPWLCLLYAVIRQAVLDYDEDWDSDDEFWGCDEVLEDAADWLWKEFPYVAARLGVGDEV